MLTTSTCIKSGVIFFNKQVHYSRKNKRGSGTDVNVSCTKMSKIKSFSIFRFWGYMSAYCTILSQYYTSRLSSLCWTLPNREDQAELLLIKRKGRIHCEGFLVHFIQCLSHSFSIKCRHWNQYNKPLNLYL